MPRYEPRSAQEVEEELYEAVETLEKPPKKCCSQIEGDRPSKRTRLDIHFESEEQPKAFFQLGISAVFVFAFAIISFLIPFIHPACQIAYLFGVALLVSLVTRSTFAQMVCVFLTAVYVLVYLLAGVDVAIGDLVNFLIGTNTISLVPGVVGIFVAILAMAAGLVNGTVGTTHYTGVVLISLAIGLALADTIVAGASDWSFLFSSHVAIYTVAFLLAWGMVYLPVRGIREGIKKVLR